MGQQVRRHECRRFCARRHDWEAQAFGVAVRSGVVTTHTGVAGLLSAVGRDRLIMRKHMVEVSCIRENLDYR
jgi:hypothetical protein